MAFHRALLRRPGQAIPVRAGKLGLNARHSAASYVDEVFTFEDPLRPGLLKGSLAAANGQAIPPSALSAVGPAMTITANTATNILTTTYAAPVNVPFAVVALVRRLIDADGNNRVMPVATTADPSATKNGFELDAGNNYGATPNNLAYAAYSGGNQVSGGIGYVSGAQADGPIVTGVWTTVAASFPAVPAHNSTMVIGAFPGNAFNFGATVQIALIAVLIAPPVPVLVRLMDDPFALLASAPPRSRSRGGAPALVVAPRARSLLFGGGD